ncbi:trimethyltridecatetraene synthase-like [Diospyros lotus]|uniref:trimethyltridecatetraene synthase-like n=1 Tax=Diospyros lotus TaxID=55363 RepID=UPI00224D1C69|nr:trimethyltridecatetraene synthase-like [Diospyros lotus]
MEPSYSWLVPSIASLLTLAILSKLFIFGRRRNLPPGPRPWPIVGNLNLIGPLPHQSLHNLSQKYGHLMQLKFGSFPVVVASSAEMAKQFLKTHDQTFASRPAMAAGKYTTYNYNDLTWAPYGPFWRQGRKVFLSELFSLKRLESFEYIRVEERQASLARLFKLSGKPIRLKDHLSRLTLSVISRIVLGRKYVGESVDDKSIVVLEEFQEILDELFLLNGVLNIGDWIPWIEFLDLQGYVKRMKTLKEKLDRFNEHVLVEHEVRRKLEGKGFVPRDMVDVLLELADDSYLEVKFTSDSVKGFIQDLIAGGTDTSATTVEWALSELLKHPNLITKAIEELDRVVGKERWVEERDFPHLPYLDAIVKETMRLHPVAVLLAPHQALEDCQVAGYHISKGTRVFINVWSMGRDPKLWESPEQFQPERFLGKAIDVKGHSFELIPFGSGRRMCPGYNLGLKMICSSLANVLHGFHLKLPEDVKEEDVSMEEVYGLATFRKVPLVAVMEPRLPSYLYQ